MRKSIHLLLAAFILFAACSEEVELSNTSVVLDITATSRVFEPAGETATRTSENYYKTEFVNGDQIGITVIKDEKIVDGINNICYTYNATTAKWEAAAGSPSLYNYQDVTYLAYYPYDAAMSDKMSEQAIINAFTPQTDQSTYANYTKSDLMTGTGTVSVTNGTPTLTFQLAHQMSLLVIYPRGQHYQTSDGYDFYAPPKDITTLQAGSMDMTAIYQPGDCTFRAIVAPGTVNVTINYITTEDVTLEYTGSVTTTSGKYSKMLLTLASPPLSYTISVGDYYFADGGLLPHDMTFAEVNKKNCRGIVFYTGPGPDDAIGNYTDTNISGNIHGYVVALKDAYPSDTDKKWGRRQVYFETGQTTQFNGYIKKYAEQTNGLCQSAAEIRRFRTAVPVPSTASNWYMPSYAQLKTIWDAYKHSEEGVIYRSLQKGGGDLFAGQYWTVTETSEHDIWTINMQTGATASNIGKCSGHDMGWNWNAYGGIHLTRVILTF